MKEPQLIPSRDGSHPSRAPCPPGQAGIALLRVTQQHLVLCDHLCPLPRGGTLVSRPVSAHGLRVACLAQTPSPRQVCSRDRAGAADPRVKIPLCLPRLPPQLSCAALDFEKCFQSQTTARPAWVLTQPGQLLKLGIFPFIFQRK